MKDRFDFDGALKEIFQEDRPTLLRHLTRGVAVREFLNVELPKVQQRRVDLVISLEDGSILQVEFQSTNDRNVGYRMVEYWPLIKRQSKRRHCGKWSYMLGRLECPLPIGWKKTIFV